MAGRPGEITPAGATEKAAAWAQMPRRAPKSVKRAGMASVPVTLMAFLCVPHHSSSAAAEHYVITTSDLPRARYQVYT